MARRRARKASGLTVKQLERSLERGEIAPVYLIVGEEDYLRNVAIEAILEALADDEHPEMALDSLDGGSDSMADVLDAARSLPLFLALADRPVRMVLVRGFDPGTAAAGELLAQYLDDPVDATCLVFEAAKIDSRRAAAKLLARKAVKIDCSPPDNERDVGRWIESSARSRGFAIEPDGVAYLLEMVGIDLQQLTQELDKAELFAAGDRLSARQLEQLLGRSREHSVFELTDALVAGQVEPALRVLNRLLDDGEEPVRILAMVSWIIRQLITAQDLAARGCPERELLQQLGGRWDQRRRVLDKAERSGARTLTELLVHCSRSDATVKMQRGAGSRGTLESLCRKVCAA